MRKLKKYFRIMGMNFKNGIAYKLDYFAGIVNIVFIIIVNIMLWKTLYKSQNLENSIQHKMMITYIILSTIFQTAFIMDEFSVESTVRDGSIIHLLLKPMSFRLYTFSNTIGRLFFNLIMLLIPSVIVVRLLFNIMLPYSLSSFLYFLVAASLGYLVLYNFNFIFWTIAINHMTSWGIVTTKNACISVLSGALIPLWLMPDKVSKILQLLPFKNIYYFPLSIYLGMVPEDEIFKGILIQLAWIALFVVVGHFVWKKALKNVVVQGG